MAGIPSEEMEGSMNASIDDFTHLSAERCLSMSSCSNSLLTKSQFGQVVFHDLCDVYLTDCDIKCRYSLMDTVNPQPGDRIGLFKVGWLSVSEYITFERAQVPTSSENNIFQVTFAADTLPKDDVYLYQLCYVTSGNVIAGASVPFGFRKPHETELIAVEDPSDPGLVVFRSRFTQLQEDLTKAVEEKDSLHGKCTSLESTVLNLKEVLASEIHNREKLAEEKTILKTQLEEVLQAKIDLEKKLMNTPTEEILSSLKSSLNSLEDEKNKIQQLLQEKVNEIKVHEATIECLKQDRKLLDENLRDYMSKNDELSLEKTSLEDRLRKMSEKHNTTVLEKLDLTEELKVLNNTNEEQEKRIRELEVLISNVYSDNPQSNDYVRRALIKVEEDRSMLEVKFMTLEEEHSKCREIMSKLKDAEKEALKLLQLEMNKGLEEIDRLKSLFEEEKKKLVSKIESLQQQKGKASKNSGKHLWTQFFQDFDFGTDEKEEIDLPKLLEEKSKLNTRLTSVLQEKADLRSDLVQVRHEKEEISKLIKDKNEENAALKSRIRVLEYELVTAKRQCSGGSTANFDNDGMLNSFNEKFDEIKSGLDKFSENITVIEKFNAIMVEKSELQEKFEQERTQKLALQKKVESLLLEDAQVYNNLQDMKNKYELLKKEKEDLEKTANGENFLMMQKLLDDADIVKTKLEEDLSLVLKEKDSLDKQLMDIRKEMVGKVSIVDANQMKSEISNLREKVKNRDCCAKMSKRLLMAGMEYGRLYTALKKYNVPAAEELDKVKVDAKSFSAEKNMICPFCHIKFPPGSAEEFAKHFENHTF